MANNIPINITNRTMVNSQDAFNEMVKDEPRKMKTIKIHKFECLQSDETEEFVKVKDILELIEEWGDCSGLKLNDKTKNTNIFSFNDVEELKARITGWRAVCIRGEY